MTIIQIAGYNGAHRNQTISNATLESVPAPEGWAVLPESVGTPETLENFPFGEIAVEDRDGVPTVTAWTPLPMPEPEPLPEEPPRTDQEARLAALEAETAALTAAVERGLSL